MMPRFTLGWKRTALVGAEHRVELDAETAVDLDLALVIDPRHAEDDLALRLAEALDQALLAVLGILGEDDLQGFEDLGHGLVELGLTRVPTQHELVEIGDSIVDVQLSTFLRSRPAHLLDAGPLGPADSRDRA